MSGGGGGGARQRAARRDGRLSVLARVQLGIEALYRVETRLEVDAFVIDERERAAAAGVARAPREQLLVRQSSDDELDLALFIDERALHNLERHDPAGGLHAANFDDFCLIVEGVSHFIYVALCAAASRQVTALELELQAEVDKFACCSLLRRDGARDDLRQRLFRDVRFADDLDATERDRYRTANGEADRYAESLERRFVEPDRVDDMLADLRRFYRLSLADKLGHIARAAG